MELRRSAPQHVSWRKSSPVTCRCWLRSIMRLTPSFRTIPRREQIPKRWHNSMDTRDRWSVLYREIFSGSEWKEERKWNRFRRSSPKCKTMETAKICSRRVESALGKPILERSPFLLRVGYHFDGYRFAISLKKLCFSSSCERRLRRDSARSPQDSLHPVCRPRARRGPVRR